MLNVRVAGIQQLERKLDQLYTVEDRREDLGKFKERVERKRRTGLGSRRNTVSAALHGDTRMEATTTLINPRQSGKSWQGEFVYAIFPALAKRVFRARARKIEERFRA